MIEAAYSWRQEDRIGSIAPGKIANFTVLEEDPYAVDPMKLEDIPVWGTVHLILPLRSCRTRRSVLTPPYL